MIVYPDVTGTETDLAKMILSIKIKGYYYIKIEK